MAIEFKAEISVNDHIASSEVSSSKKVLNNESYDLSKSEMCLLCYPQQFTFSGTDNGIVKKTTTVPFSTERFAFHLKLHNYYSVLEEENKNIDPVSDTDSKNFLNIPKATITQSSEVDLSFSFFKEIFKLEKKKKNSPKGRQIQVIENDLSQSNLTTSLSSTAQFQANFEKHITYRNEV